MTKRRWRIAGSSMEQCSVKLVHSLPSSAKCVHCYYIQAELEGSPEILLTITTPSEAPPLDPYLIVHPAVQLTSASSQLDSSAHDLEQRHRKIRFTAPSEQFTLCHYQMSSVTSLPIRGFYQMKVTHHYN